MPFLNHRTTSTNFRAKLDVCDASNSSGLRHVTTRSSGTTLAFGTEGRFPCISHENPKMVSAACSRVDRLSQMSFLMSRTYIDSTHEYVDAIIFLGLPTELLFSISFFAKHHLKATLFLVRKYLLITPPSLPSFEYINKKENACL